MAGVLVPSTPAHKKRMSAELRALKKLPASKRPPMRAIPKNVTEVETILHMFDAVRDSALEQGRSKKSANTIAASATRKKYGRKFSTASMISHRAKGASSAASFREDEFYEDSFERRLTAEKQLTGVYALGLLLDTMKEFSIPDAIVRAINAQEEQGRFLEVSLYKTPRRLTVEIHGVGKPATLRQLGDIAKPLAASSQFSFDAGEGRSELFLIFEPRGFFS